MKQLSLLNYRQIAFKTFCVSFFLIATPFSFLVAQTGVLSPGEVSGQSVREMNAVNIMSRQYAVSPNGLALPESEDDWYPDFSLNSPSATKEESRRLNASSDKKNEANTNSTVSPSAATAPVSTQSANAPFNNPFSLTTDDLAETMNPVSAQAAAPIVPSTATVTSSESAAKNSATAIPVSQPTSTATYDPGFQVGHTPILPTQFESAAPADLETPPFPPENTTQPPSLSLQEPEIPLPNTLPNIQPNTQPNTLPNSLPANISTDTNSLETDERFPVPAGTPESESSFASPSDFVSSHPAQSDSTGNNLPGSNSTEDDLSKSASTENDFSTDDPNALDVLPPSSETVSDAEMTESELSRLIVEDIRVSGLEMTTNRFNRLIKTKIGNNFDQQTLEEDKRALLQTRQFVDVTVSTTTNPNKPETIIVNFDLTPRRLMQYIKVIGNRCISKSDILEELGIKRGETRMDPYDVETGRLRIIELYKSKNYNTPHVTILEGDRPEDIGVIYLIDEGLKKKVFQTKFIGNTVASSSRLRSLVSVKPGFFYIFGGDFSRERLDEDVMKLLEYYRKLGYFEAQIDREFDEGDVHSGLFNEKAWITVRYIIHEGPRYRIRNFLFEGNSIIPTDKLQSVLKVQQSDFYNQNNVEGDRIALKLEYEDIGYVLADVTPTPIFTEEEGMLDVRYSIKEGKRYRVKDIKIQYEGGEARTKSTVVLNMIDITPGQLLIGKKIRSSEATMQRSGIFNDKPAEGPLPSLAIVPEDESRLLSEKVAHIPGTHANTMADLVEPQSDSAVTAPSEAFPDNSAAEGAGDPRLPANGLAPSTLPQRSTMGDTIRGQKSQDADVEERSSSNSDEIPQESRSNKTQGQVIRGQEKQRSTTSWKFPLSRKASAPIMERTLTVTDVQQLPARSDVFSGNALSANTLSGNNASSGASISESNAILGSNAISGSNATLGSNVILGNNASSKNNADPRYAPAASQGTLPQESGTQPPLIRGQSRQVPTSFGNVATQSPVSSTASGYSYASSNTRDAQSTGSVYSDTSMYYNQNAGNTQSVNQTVSSMQNSDPGYATTNTSVANPNSTWNQSGPTEVAAAPGFDPNGATKLLNNDTYSPNILFGNRDLLYPEDNISNADVIAKIKEGRTGLIQASIGVNSDYGLVGNFSFTENNFDITRFPTALWRADGWTDAFRGAGQRFNVTASPGTEVSRYFTSWDVPYVFDTKNTFGVSGLYGNHDYTEWYETRVGGELRLGRQWTPRFSTTVKTSAYSVKIEDPCVWTIPDLNRVLGTNAMYSVGLFADYDTRNHPFLPSQGYRISGGIEQTFGDYTYPSASLEGKLYHTLYKRPDESGRWILGLRSAAGWLGDDAPIYERFYGGGFNNLRGFEYREVTPRYAGTRVGVGGNFEFYNSAELLVPMSGGDEFQLAFFVDTGTVSKNLKDWDKYRVAPGMGLRISIPMLGPAPLALDFAYPVNKDENDVTQVFSFSLSALR